MLDLPADYFPIEIYVELTRAEDLPGFLAVLEQLGPEAAVEMGPEPGSALIAGRSETALLQIVRQLEDATGAGLTIGPPQVVYRERLGQAAEIDFTHKTQTGGTGQFARVKLHFEPGEESAGFTFESRIIGGAVPEECVPVVRRGLDRARQDGLVAGYPVTDFRAILLDGAYHDTDSSPLAFEIAARGAFRQLKTAADPRLMAPVVNVRVAVPEEFAEVVRAVVKARGGVEIIPLVPDIGALATVHASLADFLGLEAELDAATGGKAETTLRFAGMREVPRASGGGDDGRFPPAVGMRA